MASTHSSTRGPSGGPATSQGAFTQDQAKALSIATFGGMLEFYEFIIFIFVAPIIGKQFFPADMPAWIAQIETLAIFAAGYLVRPVGGIFLASIGDKIGRKKMFVFTLFLLAVPTTLIGLLPTYAQIGYWAPILLLLCRMTQGLSIGGEVPGALIYAAESIPARRLGFGCGVLAASFAVGTVLGSGTVTGLTALLGKEAMFSWGWRIPFVVGGVFGILAVVMRRFAAETPVFQEMARRKSEVNQVPVKDVFSKHRVPLVLCILVATMTAVVTSGIHQFPVSFFVTTKGLDPSIVFRGQFLAAVFLIPGDLFAGWLADRIGVRRAFTISTSVLIAAVIWFFGSQDVETLTLRYIVVGFMSGTVAMTFIALIRSFPADVRYTGIAASYNLASALIGGTTPLLLAFLARFDTALVIGYICVLCALAIVALHWLQKYEQPINPFAPDA